VERPLAFAAHNGQNGGGDREDDLWHEKSYG